MDLKEVADHFKHAREAVSSTPLGMLPPQLLCLREEDLVCSVMAPDSTPWAIAAALAAIPVTKPDMVFLLVEVLTGDKEDPQADRALCVVQSVPAGVLGSETHPYRVGDDGSIEWKPELEALPVVGLLAGAIGEMFGFDVQNSAADLMLWFQINGFAARIEPGLLLGESES